MVDQKDRFDTDVVSFNLFYVKKTSQKYRNVNLLVQFVRHFTLMFCKRKLFRFTGFITMNRY